MSIKYSKGSLKEKLRNLNAPKNTKKKHLNLDIERLMQNFKNDFLVYYIGWNFSVAVMGNLEFEKALINFYNIVIEKGLKKYAGNGFEVWDSEDVKHYKLKV